MFFDNLQVTHTAGHILEETHYYPFGLAMAGISSRALNNIAPNNYKFNAGNELNENFGINLYETFYRLQDVQTGRFLNADPYAEKYFGLTPYNYAANNPVSINDPLGDQMKYPGDNGRMQKGPDGNYHTSWVNEMMWNQFGFYDYNDMFGGGSGGGNNNFYNIRGMSSQSVLNQMQFGNKFGWNKKKSQFGYWSINSFDPTENGYQEAAGSGGQLQEVAVGTKKTWVAYKDQSGGGSWDLNGDGQLGKVEADDHYMNGHGKPIVVDGNKIDLGGLEAKDMTYNTKEDIYSLGTTKAFKVLPWKTAATYGGSNFKLVNGKWQMLSQGYHYKMRSWNTLENDVRNILTIFGDPANTLRPSEMNNLDGQVAPKGEAYKIIIQY